ncbi:MAG TPA: zinc ribbon domain-containing protein [Thermoleophilia bacterium]|nr:zinc ribbon domain-containing protein [Acidobacteriota bacterium]OPZ45787.1 MAG: Double zinc ribbon [Actinobacteria bacterium ADurb.BinA094]HOU28058.1 zinc ribbon domain-containing protein [Thermoleophilia bacterium]HQF52465.1 zinc ribbon domain-containing protein [Thermoleophilia bacterium]HQH22115.1 zinc ribbon domain-containing protein [Thermoleophilia bacterium]
MAGEIEFTRNYSDLSTDNGFQFEFFCDRCGNGYRTEFDTFGLSAATNVLDSASGLLGGVFGRAADVTQRAKSAAWEKASDKAFRKAAEQIRPRFVQCPRCSAWMCRDHCWNEKKGLCKQCAPDLGVEMAAAQASRSVEEVWAHAKMAEEDKHLTEADWREGITASCPKCGAPQATNAKFCPQCGADLKAVRHCSQCGVQLQPGAKFCSGCGAPVS